MTKDLFTLAVEGLEEYYPILSNAKVVKTLRGQVDIPDTGDAQKDYEKVRDSIEKLVE